jgi:hypothetical protein
MLAVLIDQRDIWQAVVAIDDREPGTFVEILLCRSQPASAMTPAKAKTAANQKTALAATRIRYIYFILQNRSASAPTSDQWNWPPSFPLWDIYELAE